VADNVVLVGFMGAGKSSVGRLLARRLGRCFVETDDVIAAREGRSIPAIFAERGEAHFRALEGEVVDVLALKRGDVIATGGGFPCAEGRMAALKALGTVVWLAGDFDVLYERAARAGGRPVLAGQDRDAVRRLYDARRPYYAEAHHTVDTSALQPDQVVLQILKQLRRPAPAPAG
jgi:shikimate kinase